MLAKFAKFWHLFLVPKTHAIGKIVKTEKKNRKNRNVSVINMLLFTP